MFLNLALKHQIDFLGQLRAYLLLQELYAGAEVVHGHLDGRLVVVDGQGGLEPHVQLHAFACAHLDFAVRHLFAFADFLQITQHLQGRFSGEEFDKLVAVQIVFVVGLHQLDAALVGVLDQHVGHNEYPVGRVVHQVFEAVHGLLQLALSALARSDVVEEHHLHLLALVLDVAAGGFQEHALPVPGRGADLCFVGSADAQESAQSLQIGLRNVVGDFFANQLLTLAVAQQFGHLLVAIQEGVFKHEGHTLDGHVAQQAEALLTLADGTFEQHAFGDITYGQTHPDPIFFLEGIDLEFGVELGAVYPSAHGRCAVLVSVECLLHFQGQQLGIGAVAYHACLVALDPRPGGHVVFAASKNGEGLLVGLHHAVLVHNHHGVHGVLKQGGVAFAVAAGFGDVHDRGLDHPVFVQIGVL